MILFLYVFKLSFSEFRWLVISEENKGYHASIFEKEAIGLVEKLFKNNFRENPHKMTS